MLTPLSAERHGHVASSEAPVDHVLIKVCLIEVSAYETWGASLINIVICSRTAFPTSHLPPPLPVVLPFIPLGLLFYCREGLRIRLPLLPWTPVEQLVSCSFHQSLQHPSASLLLGLIIDHCSFVQFITIHTTSYFHW